jgi:hypothetical protein
MKPETTPGAHKYFEIVDEEGQIVEIIGAIDRNEAIRKFCYPALEWRTTPGMEWPTPITQAAPLS